MSEVNVQGLVAMCEELGRIAGKDFKEVIVPEVGQLLRACIRRTGYKPHVTQGMIAKRVSKRYGHVEFADGTIISIWKKATFIDAEGYEYAPTMFLDTSTYPQYAARWPKGTPIPKVQGGKTWHQMDDNRHWSNARFASYTAHQKARRKQMRQTMREKLAARGLAKKTWWQIAQDLGLDLQIPSWITGARDPKGRPFKEGLARQLIEQGSFIVEIINANPLVVGRLNGREILAGALLDREKAFMHELRTGVFDDLKMRAKRHPGVFTS